MTTPFPYRRPGIYIKESLQPLPVPVVAPGTAIAAFVGEHYSGPTLPVKITAWDQFVNLYGGFGSGLDYLPFAVYSYFANGGQQAWIQRAVPDQSKTATRTFLNGIPQTVTPKIPETPSVAPPVLPGTVPQPPTGLRLSSVTPAIPENPEQTNVQIEWIPPAGGSTPTHYRIEVLSSAGGPVLQTVYMTPPAAPGPVVCGLANLIPGKSYNVRVYTQNNISPSTSVTLAQSFMMKPEYIPQPALLVSAKGRGAYGNSIYISLTPAYDLGRFNLLVRRGDSPETTVTVETWQDVSLNPSDGRYIVGMINSNSAGSNLITVENLLPPIIPQPGTSQTPDLTWRPVTTGESLPLEGGTDSPVVPNLAEILRTNFSTISDVLLINVTGQDKDPINYPNGIPPTAAIVPVLRFAEERGKAFVVLDAPNIPAPATPQTAVDRYKELLPAATASSGPPPTGAYTASSYAAFYGPWIAASDPAGQSVSSTRLLPPGGSVMGQFAKADAAVGPNRAPAGVSYPLVSAVGVQHLFSLNQLDELNELGVNVIRPIPQAGYCIMGARTLRRGRPDRYVPVRRMLTYLSSLLEDVTQFAIFEPNGPLLWQKISALVDQQLHAITQSGQLQSEIPEQAYFVLCDSTNNTPATVANGEVHVRVGVALASPAEFIVIEISQYQGQVSQTTNSLQQTLAQ